VPSMPLKGLKCNGTLLGEKGEQGKLKRKGLGTLLFKKGGEFIWGKRGRSVY